MHDTETELDQILETLVRDVVASVHAMYRGEVGQQTAKLKTAELRAVARAALLQLVVVQAPPLEDTDPAPFAASALTSEQVGALTRC
ncbi:MAG: hypothetical protein ACREN3_05700, partial [Gemmatimonadaceae bacterium]